MKKNFFIVPAIILGLFSLNIYADELPNTTFEDTKTSNTTQVIEQQDLQGDNNAVSNNDKNNNIDSDNSSKNDNSNKDNDSDKIDDINKKNDSSKDDDSDKANSDNNVSIDDSITDNTSSNQILVETNKPKLETVNNYRMYTFKIYDPNSKKTYNLQANKVFTYDYKQKVPPLKADEWSYNVFVKRMEEFFSDKNGKDMTFAEKISNKNRYSIVTKKSGQIKIDKKKLKEDLMNRIRIADYSTVTLPITEDSKQMLKAKKDELIKLGQYTTYYNTYDYGRTQNIIMAGKELDGIKLNPGEVFSYNKRTLPIYPNLKVAKVIVNNEFVDGFGGGLCQHSTTLFNTVIESGLKVNHRLNHSLKVKYVPLGRDAMVSNLNDLIFTNNFKNPVYLKYYQSGPNGITFTIYGSKSDKKTVKTWTTGSGSDFVFYRQIGNSVDKFRSHYAD